MTRIALLLLSSLVLTNCSTGVKNLVENDQTIKMYNGEYMEFIGLEYETAEEFFNKIAPQDKILNVKMPPAKFCSGVIENELKYPVVSGFQFGKLTTIVVVEPQNEKYLRTYPLPETKRDTITRWNAPLPLQEGDNYEMVGNTSQFLYTNGRRIYTPLPLKVLIPFFIGREPMKFSRKLKRHIKQFDTEADYQLALDVLRNDGNPANRTWAMLVLRNFKPTAEIAELLIIEPMREFYGYGTQIANFSLSQMTKLPKYWETERLAQHVIPAFYGSNPRLTARLLTIMQEVSFNETDALKLIPERDFFIRQMLISQYPDFGDGSKKMLSNLAGKNLKTTEEALAWLDELQEKRASLAASAEAEERVISEVN